MITLAAAVLALVLQPFTFTVPPVDQVQDLHGDPAAAQLVVFMAGNQFMVMPPLMEAFQKTHPSVHGIFYETLPPGILARQIAAGGLRIGNLVITAKPDVVLSGRRRMAQMRSAGLVGTPVSYATNVLAIMIRKGNPRNVRSLRDLGRSDVRVAMPNPAWEGVAEQIESAYERSGGKALVQTIMLQKVRAGTTMLTRIHHRQTPLFILGGRADAGPVWITEALYQQRIGEPIDFVRIPESANVAASYEAATMLNAPHAAAAKAFVEFLESPAARAIFRSYGFGPPDKE